MILFCDTSALAKLFIDEEHSGQMLEAAQLSSAISVCRIAWVEMMAAMARRVREIPSDANTIDSGRSRFEQMWPDFAVIEVNQKLVRLAGDIAEAFALRAYDSVQLAAAQRLHQSARGEMTFACFDKRLQKAAAVMGIQILEFI